MHHVLEEGEELVRAYVLGHQPLALLEDQSQFVLLRVDEDLEQLAQLHHLIAIQALLPRLQEVDIPIGD